jgi:cell division protein FtsX
VVAALVVVSAAVAVTVIFLTGKPEAQAPPPAVPPPAPAACAGYLVVYVGTDDEATSTAAALRDDPQVVTTFVETREQAYARFKEVFKDRPDLLDQVRPESVPASVSLVPAGSIDLEQWATRIRAKFPTAQQVAVMDGAKAPDTLKAALDKLQVHLCPPGR